MSKKSKSQDDLLLNDKPPMVLHVLTNLFLTFALSLSMYLFITNFLLTMHRINLKSMASFKAEIIDEEARFMENLNHLKMQQVEHTYYDCNRHPKILSKEECELINNYHSEYLNSVRLSNADSNHQLKQFNSLRVNTSFFIR